MVISSPPVDDISHSRSSSLSSPLSFSYTHTEVLTTSVLSVRSNYISPLGLFAWFGFPCERGAVQSFELSGGDGGSADYVCLLLHFLELWGQILFFLFHFFLSFCDVHSKRLLDFM